MNVESKSRPESVGRRIAESSIGWAVSTVLVLTPWRAAAALCGFYFGVRGKLDRTFFRKMPRLDQEVDRGS